MNTKKSATKRTFSRGASSKSTTKSYPRSSNRSDDYSPSEASSYGSRAPRSVSSGESRGSSYESRAPRSDSYGTKSYSPRTQGGSYSSSRSGGSSYSPSSSSSYAPRSSSSSAPIRTSFGSSRYENRGRAPMRGGSAFPATSAPSRYGQSSSYSSGGGYSSGGSSYGRSSDRGGYSSGSQGGGYSSGSRFGDRGGFGGRSSGGHGGYARGGSSFGGGRRSGGGRGQHIDVSKFINRVDHTAVKKTEVKYVPKNAFNDFNIAEDIKARIAVKGFINPSPIQDAAIPYILEGKDVVGIANTGTGKTAAFLIPLVDKVINNPKEQVLIMAPTRELAIQIQEELLVFIKNTKIYSVCCVGGAPIRRQISELKYFNNFIIGTPGRLKDLGEQKYINFSAFTNVVLDEADRMLDMGFIDDMRMIIGRMPKERQTLFFTATMSREIEKLIHEFLNDPVNVSVKTGDTAKSVDQDVVRVGRGESKIDKLHEILSHEESTKVLIFGQTKSGVERLTNELHALGHKVGSIHGDKNHVQRQRTLKAFKDNIINILVATDVAARGLDIVGVTHVINYELPMTYDDYVHRIGRTGRGGATGKALTFVASH